MSCRTRGRWTTLAIAAVIVGLASCGGGGDGASSAGTTPAPPVTPVTPVTPMTPAVPAPSANAISLQSDAGDPIGLGKSYAYASTSATIAVGVAAGHLTIAVTGDEQWSADFVAPRAQSMLQVGTYPGLSNLPVIDASVGAFRWFGQGRGCSASTSTVTIDHVAYSAGLLSSLILRFERHCDGAVAALRGEVRWTSADSSRPPGPVSPPPVGLWTPPAGALPTTGNYVFLQSDPGEIVGLGQTRLFTSADSSVLVSGAQQQTIVEVYGNEIWSGTFKAMESQSRLVVGYFPNLKGLPFNNPVRGGVAWIGEGRGCVALGGWFAIDRIAYGTDGRVTAITARFEQACEGSSAVLRGAVSWDAPPDRSALPPAILAPAGSWHAPAPALPATGNYFYTSSGPGDDIGDGRTTLDTPLDSVFAVTSTGASLSARIATALSFNGQFTAPTGQNALQAGVYDGLTRPTQVNPLGTTTWSSNTTACSSVRAWVAIDAVTYSAGVLTAIDLRFEQACGSATATLKGQLHWRADDLRTPRGPVTPAPAQLWRPAAGTTPAGRNYVHLDSDRGDFVGQGIVADYTQADSVLSLTPTGGGLTIAIAGDQEWTLAIQPMSGVSQLQVGYYPGLSGTPFNPAKGGLDFYGEGRGCNTSQGGFVIDNVAYANGTLTALDLRFEKHCEGTAPAIRGSVHYANTDASVPPGPVFPPPAQLWRPPSGATAETGSYVYLQSEPGDFLGNGQTSTSTAPASSIVVSRDIYGATHVEVTGPMPGSGDLAVMSSRTQLEPGYYGNLQRYPFNNPARGGFDWSSQGRGCNTLSGWFVVDSVAYQNGALSALDLRFEQYCDEGSTAPLHGRIRWER